MLKNILLSFLFIGAFVNISAQNQVLESFEPNQIAHSQESLDNIRNTILSHWKQQEMAFFFNRKYLQDGIFNGIRMQESFFEIKPCKDKNILMQIVLYWVLNRPWSKEDATLKKAFLDAKLVNEKGIVFQDIAEAIYKNIVAYTNKNITYIDDDDNYNNDVKEFAKPDLENQLEENQKAHQAMYISIIENIYKEIDTQFNERKKALLIAREKPESVRQLDLNLSMLDLYPRFTEDVLYKLTEYWVLNLPWSAVDSETKDILCKEEFVDKDGIIRSDLVANLFLSFGISFSRRDDVILYTVKKKITLFSHIKHQPADLYGILIASNLYDLPKQLDLNHTITKEEMIRLFSIWIVPQLWHQLSAQEQQSLTETGYITKDGIISHENHVVFLLGFDIILKENVKDKFPEASGYKSEQVELVDLQKIMDKAENKIN